jgi:hypothetical protein
MVMRRVWEVALTVCSPKPNGMLSPRCPVIIYNLRLLSKTQFTIIPPDMQRHPTSKAQWRTDEPRFACQRVLIHGVGGRLQVQVTGEVDRRAPKLPAMPVVEHEIFIYVLTAATDLDVVDQGAVCGSYRGSAAKTLNRYAGSLICSCNQSLMWCAVFSACFGLAMFWVAAAPCERM